MKSFDYLGGMAVYQAHSFPQWVLKYHGSYIFPLILFNYNKDVSVQNELLPGAFYEIRRAPDQLIIKLRSNF